jgi:hypothetical protein
METGVCGYTSQTCCNFRTAATRKACGRDIAIAHSATPELLQLLTPDSRFPSETDVIIDVKKIKPGSDIVSVWGEFLKRFVEMLAALVIGRSAPAMIFRPV